MLAAGQVLGTPMGTGSCPGHVALSLALLCVVLCGHAGPCPPWWWQRKARGTLQLREGLMLL